MDQQETSLKEIFGKTGEGFDVAILDSVINYIFTFCDKNMNGMVETNKLIEFITPFVEKNPTAVAELKKSLDPSDSNPMIDKETFHNNMKTWTLIVSSMEGENDPNVTPVEFQRPDEGNLSYVQSTPRSSFGHHLLKSYVESGVINTSACSTYSLQNEFTSAKTSDRTVLEEHIQELEHHKKKISDELLRVKAELANSLESNESLQGELNRILKKLNNEQKLNQQLQIERKRDDETEVELCSTKKQVVGLKEMVSSMEKQIFELNGDLKDMQIEYQKLEQNNAQISKKNAEALEVIISLQNEIEASKQELVSAKEENNDLRQENGNLHDEIEQYSCEIDKLKFEKSTMEEFLRVTKKKAGESIPSRSKLSRSNSCGEFSPILKRLLTTQAFSTPNTISKLNNPISPLSNDSPIFESNHNNECKQNKASTPKSLLDTTNPSHDALSPLIPVSSKGNSLESPPTLYILERTDDLLTEQDHIDGFKESDSGDDLPVKLHYIAVNTETNESLQEEISKATSAEYSFGSEDFHCKHKCEENENRVANVRSEVMCHKDKESSNPEECNLCAVCLKICKDYELKISQLSNEYLNLKTQLSLSTDKEFMLLEQNRSLEGALQLQQNQIMEVNKKLGEYHKLEIKCKELGFKIESLENENSAKYVKIVELTIEIDRLRNGLAKVEEEEQKDIEEVLTELKNEKEEAEYQKTQLEDRLKYMEEERVGLKIEIQTLLTKIMNLEETERDIIHEKGALKLERDSLKSENESLREKYSIMEASLSEFEKSAAKIELIESEKELLKTENDSLRKDIENFQNEVFSAKSSNSSLEKEQRDLIELGFKLKLENLEREKNIIYEDRQRLSDEIIFVNQERDNMLHEIRRLRKQLHYKEQEFEMQLNQSKKELNNYDAEKQDMEAEIFSLKGDLQDFVSLKNQHEQLTNRYEKLREDLRLSNGKLEENLLEISSLKKLQEKYEIIQCELTKNTKEISILKSEKGNLSTQMNKLKVQLDECQVKLEEYKNLKEVQSEKLEKTLTDKNHIQNEVRKLKSDITGLLQKNEEISFSLEKAKSETTICKNDKHSLQRDYEKLKEKLRQCENLDQKYKELTNTCERIKKEYDILRVTHEFCGQSYKELDQKSSKSIANYRAELVKVEKENEELRKENFALKSKINTLDRDIFQLKQNVSYYHNEKRDYDEIKFNLVRENQELSSKLEKSEQNIKKQNTENKQLSVENVDLQIKIQKSETAIATYANMNNQLKATNESLNSLLEEKDQLISEMKEELVSFKKTNEILDSEIRKLSVIAKKYEETKLSLEQKEEDILVLAKENALLKDAKQNLNEELFLFKEMCENYKHKLEETEEQIKTLEDHALQNDDKLQNRELKITELQNEIDQKLQELKELKEKFDEMKDCNKKLKEIENKFEEEKRLNQIEVEHKNKLLLEFEELQNKYAKSQKIIQIFEKNIKNMGEDLNSKSVKLEDLEQKTRSLLSQNKNLTDVLQHPNNLLDRLKELSEENEILREECKKFCIQDKIKMIEETNKSFSDALKKMYTAEKRMSETEEDFHDNCLREIEKYKMENTKFKSEIANLTEEKKSIINQLKSIESENESKKNELETLLTERESWLSQNIDKPPLTPCEFKKKDKKIDIWDRCKSDGKLNPKWTNFDKLNMRKEKLERKVQDLEEQLIQEKETLADAISQKNEIKKELEDLRAEYLKLQSQMKTVENQIEALNHETKSALEEKKKCYSPEKATDISKSLEEHKEKLRELLRKLDEEECDKVATFTQLHHMKESLSEKRFRLERYTLTIATTFRVPDSFLRKMLTAEMGEPKIPEVLLHIDKEIGRMREQIDITSNVLDYLAMKRSRTVLHTVGCQTENLDVKCEKQKLLMKSNTFTLRPPKLIPKQPLDLESLKFASSGDAGRSRDLSVLYPRYVENAEENEGGRGEDCQEQHLSPALDDDTLEDLGLLQTDSSNVVEIPDQELQHKFDRIVTACETDRVSLKTRLAIQSARMSAKERQLAAELTAYKTLLEDTLEDERLNTGLAQLELVSKGCAQVSALAVQFGLLKQEQRLANCMALLIHYAAYLKRRLDDVEDRHKYISQHVKVAHQLQQIDIEGINVISASAETQKLRRWRPTIEPIEPIETHIFPRPSSRTKQFITICFFTWIVFVAICSLFLLSTYDNGAFTIPWTWENFDDFWSPFIKKRYVNGPPPT